MYLNSLLYRGYPLVKLATYAVDKLMNTRFRKMKRPTLQVHSFYDYKSITSLIDINNEKTIRKCKI